MGSKESATRRQRAKEVFFSAVELPAEEIPGYLEAACGEDADLRGRVERLLAGHAGAGSILAGRPPLLLPGDAIELAPGDVVGDYRLVEEIGEGGFGRVFLAQQERPLERSVAFKVIKAGMDTRQVIGRFEAERQTLAVMQHPNIAGVLDAGATASGRPYFVMEYVPGEPITDYCRGHDLGLRARVQLVRKVCAAIQHAHVKGVLHRDIKPTNVLVLEVDGRPEPRVIDFGIAKAIGSQGVEPAERTAEGLLVGTPVYMSPEQMGSKLDIDTRSDVHALGALLFELLVGRPPFGRGPDGAHGSGDLDTIRTRILHQDAEPPSRAVRAEALSGGVSEAVPRELDWIVQRCLEKDRERRYSSAAALGLDLERFLCHEPVEAAPRSRTYILRKLVRRHRAAAWTACAVALALLLGALGTLLGLLEARDEAREARLQAEIAQAVSAFLTEDLLQRVRPSEEEGEGWDVPMSEVLDAAAERLDAAAAPGGRFEHAPRIEASIRLALGSTYGALGRDREAEPHLLRAHELFLTELGPDHVETRRADAAYLPVLLGMGRYDECVERGRRLLSRIERVFGASASQAFEVRNRVGHALRRLGRNEEAAAVYRTGLTLGVEAHGADSDPAVFMRNGLALVEIELGHFEAAEDLLRGVLEVRRRDLGPEDPNTLTTLQNLGGLMLALGRLSEARPLLEEALAGMERTSGPAHPATLKTLFNLATIHRELGDLNRAEDMLLGALDSTLAAHGPEHLDTIQIEGGLARLAMDRGAHDEAELVLAELVERCAGAHGLVHPKTLSLRKDLAIAVFQLGRIAEARTLLTDLLEDEIEENGPCHPSTLLTLGNLNSACKRLGDEPAAEAYLRQVVACGAELPPDHPSQREVEAARSELDR